ncbi:MAG: phosphoenolpyruvate synthase [Epsilonproteobacteria bacterium]|nr:phosphoenolpyruvate synthase [Campylobacterota bacterium]
MKYVKWLNEVTIDDLPLVGGKNASLGEMTQELSAQGINVARGFAITSNAYWRYLDYNGLREKIKRELDGLDTQNTSLLREKTRYVRDLITFGKMPDDLTEEITAAYKQMCEQYGDDTAVAVRSSATAEDMPDASFAGQQDTYLNISGIERILERCRSCYGSIFTERATSYRHDKNYDDFNVALSIGINVMVRSDLASSGVAFSVDTESGFTNAVLIDASYGLGEMVVSGQVNPDEYYVFKPTLAKGYNAIIAKRLGAKAQKMIYSDDGSDTKIVDVSEKERNKFALNDDDILHLAKWVVAVEAHYTEKNGHYTPMDVEWAKDGKSGELFIVQARPETVQSQKKLTELVQYHLDEKGDVIITGNSVGEKIASGKAVLMDSPDDIEKLEDGAILVTDITDPDWEPIMKKASAIVTNRGGRTCHAAIISREIGIPAIVGTLNCTEKIKNGQNITISCAQGDVGFVYDGLLKYHKDVIDLSNIEKPKTKIKMNVGNPSIAFKTSFLPSDGVGLARMEFIINSYIQIHPLALIHPERVKSQVTLDKINSLTAGYENKADYFVDRLADGMALISAAFYPKQVLIRTSDFKSNEYANLIGGKVFEPIEENPMIGFRGASRYYSDSYKEGFALECRAIKKVREEMGLTNLTVMIPFCRTPEEGKKVIEVMEANGLKRGENGLEIYVMCEIPSNVILADRFSEIFDGFSIGSNDLTQLTLGLDRDSSVVAHLFDEKNEAVKRMIHMVIQTAHKYNRSVGICGQAPSDYPEFAQFLVSEGIDSISLNPDSVMKTTLSVLEMEKKLNK